MVQSLWFKISFQNFSISTTGYEEPGYRLHFVCTSNFLYLVQFITMVLVLDTHDSLLIAINHDGHLFSENISNQLVRNSIRSVSEKNVFRGNLSRVFRILEILKSILFHGSILNLSQIRGILPDAHDRFYHKNIHQLVIIFILFRDSKILACFSEESS